MMRCAEVRKMWTLYVEEQVTDAQRAAIEQHLGDCQSCQLLPVVEPGLAAMLRERLPRQKAPAALRERILAALPSEEAAETGPAVLASPAVKAGPSAQGSGSWASRLLGSPWSSRLAMAAIIGFMVLVPGRLLFRAPAIAVEAVDRYERHLAAHSVAELKCCHPLDLLPGDPIGEPAKGVTVPDLTSDGLQFVLAGRCDYGGTDATVLVYQSMGEEAFSLYITDRAMENFEAIRSKETGGIRQARHHVRSSDVTIWERQGLIWFWVGPHANPEYSTALADLCSL